MPFWDAQLVSRATRKRRDLEVTEPEKKTKATRNNFYFWCRMPYENGQSCEPLPTTQIGTSDWFVQLFSRA
ncbi:hypothetical protein NDU88_001625 [Pleurodeles waltl]|uniref:Uncharacterized protein n=1 Tax=Pleurodeles waltl TaxID=8319 RepID=A0AAV7LHY8_PLEWA|nr:hypothetical protein NDU88_001625 [Pleurodeles waltl]